MSLPTKADRLHGVGHHDALFKGNPLGMVPLPQAPRRKDRHLYDKEKVRSLIGSKDAPTKDYDVRTLHATQPHVTRAGVKHYMEKGEEGGTYARGGGNAKPTVYEREDGVNILLSGHHRAVAALLKGKPLNARYTKGPWPAKDA